MEVKSMIGSKVLVEISTPDTTTASGLFVPSKPNFEGTVLMTGPNVIHLKVGDKVKYFEHSGVTIGHDNKKCIILREKDDIIAVL